MSEETKAVLNAGVRSLAEAVAAIPDGAKIAMGKTFPMAIVREIIRQQKRDLHLVGMPIAGLPADLLAGAGVVSVVEAGAVTLGPDGIPAAFLRATEEGQVERRRSSCSLIVASLVGGAAGAPFVALPGLLGSDLLADRPDIRIIDNPLVPGEKTAIAPVIRPDFALIHARRADLEGNLVVASSGDEALLARSAFHLIATVESISADALDRIGRDEEVIPALYADAIIPDPWGTYPFPSNSFPKRDEQAIREWLAAAQSPDETRDWIQRNLGPGTDESHYRQEINQ